MISNKVGFFFSYLRWPIVQLLQFLLPSSPRLLLLPSPLLRLVPSLPPPPLLRRCPRTQHLRKKKPKRKEKRKAAKPATTVGAARTRRPHPCYQPRDRL